MVCQLTIQLYGRFPREVGLYRSTVTNIDQFIKYVNKTNGITDAYTSVYPSNFLIDKIFFDMDWGKHVLEDAQKLYATCLDEGFKDVIPVISGLKGYHIYPICRPKIYGKEAKINLLRTSYHLLEQAFGKFRAETKTIRGKDVHCFKNKDRIIAPDPAVIADVRRLCRIPGTLRPPENNNYCTYVNPNEFLDMTELDIVDYMKSPHTPRVKINFRHAPKLEDYDYKFEKVPDFNPSPIELPDEKHLKVDNKLLKSILRPCLYRHITHQHPSDYVRHTVTLDLLSIGLSIDSVVSIYSGLGWEDFSDEITKGKVSRLRTCMKQKPEIYHSVPCGTLRRKSIPRRCCIE